MMFEVGYTLLQKTLLGELEAFRLCDKGTEFSKTTYLLIYARINLDAGS